MLKYFKRILLKFKIGPCFLCRHKRGCVISKRNREKIDRIFIAHCSRGIW